MACQLFRTDGKVEKVLAPNEKPSLLYSEILSVVQKEGSKKFIDSIPYLRDRLADGTLLNESPEEIAVGIWSIAYSPEYQAFFTNLNKTLNAFADQNGEPKFAVFNSNVLNQKSRFGKVSTGYVLDPQKAAFVKAAIKKGNKLQQAIIGALVENPENPVILEPKSHTYIDAEGEVYTSTTTAIKGKLESDAFAANRAIGTSVDKLLQGIIEGKNFKDSSEGITEIDEATLKNLFTTLQAYVAGITSDGSVVVTQVALGDSTSKIAGSLDLLVVSPTGKLKVIDLKVSKNSVKSEAYDRKFGVKQGSVFVGQTLSTRQQHGIQVGTYKKLIELAGFEVEGVSTVHLKIDLDSNNKITDVTFEGEVNHPLSINKNFVDKVIPTEVEPRDRASELRRQLKTDNPADDPSFLTDEESKPEEEVSGDMYDRMYQEVRKVIDLFETRKKYLEKIRGGKTSIDKNIMIDKINELIVMMGSELRIDKPSTAYGAFLRYTTEEVKDYLRQITDPNAINDPNYINLLLEVDKYIESYRGIVNVKGVGSKAQQAMLLELLGLLDDIREAIDNNTEAYVKKVVKENTSRDLTEAELTSIMKEVYDIPVEDYLLGDMATSKDTLLAIADKIYKSAINKAKDNTESTINRIQEIGNKLLKAAGVSKPDSKFFDFMKVFDKSGKFVGRYVTKVGSQYYDMYYSFKNRVTEKNGERKQYVPILDLASARKEDIDYNVNLFYDKAAFTDFQNAEILGPNGAEDGKYHKYTDTFKAIRNRYQELVGYNKIDGSVFYRWEKKADVSDEQYEQFRLKYFNEVSYWGPEMETDGTFKGRVSLKSNYFVKNDFIEVRDIAEDGTDLRDSKYVKLMNPKTELEKAQSEFYKEWIEQYQNSLEKLPPEVAAQMRGKIGRVRGAFFDTLKSKGSGFTKAVAKGIKGLFTSEVYTNQRLVDELGQIDRGLPVMYVGKLQNEGRLEYLNNELTNLKNKRAQGKIGQKEYLQEKKKLKEYIKIESGRVKASEIEGDLVNNLIAFATMAENYEVMDNIESDLQAIAKIMNDRTYYETDSLGNKLIRKGSKLSKNDDGTPVVKRPEDVRATKRLDKWFKMVYYNNQEFNRSTLAMVAGRIQNLTSLKGVGFNVFGNINNYIMARINTSIETAGALYYDRSAAQRAVKEYNTDYIPSMFAGIGKTKQNFYQDKKAYSKYQALVEYFRMVKKYQSDSGKVDVMSWAYFLQEGGEYNAQSKSGVAVLMSRQLTNSKTGETQSIYDAFNFDPNTGELSLKDGYELSEKERYDTINYILEVNKQIHGNYAFEDRMIIQEHWIGQLAAQFHKWVYPSYKTRFKLRYVDENLGEVEGRYASVLSLLQYYRESEGSFLEKLRSGWKGLDEIQVKNMYKNLAELAFFAASFAMYGVFRALSEGADDDDKTLKRWLNFMAYQQSRQMTEVSTMMPIVGMEEQYLLAKSPIAILTTLRDFGQALKSTLLIPFPPYDKNYYERGPHEGDLKAWKEWKDIIPALSVLNKWEAYDNVKSFYIK